MLHRPHVRNAIVLGAAIGVFGVAFGVLAVQAGLSPWQALAMSLLVFTGGSQFAAIGVIDAGGTTAAAIGAALLLATRNGVYGATLAARFGKRLRPRVLATQLVIDESTAMSAARDDDDIAIEAFWAAGLSVYLFWNLGTAIGAWGGQIIGDPETLGLDAALPAGFVAMLLPLARTRRGLAAAGWGALIALVALPFTPPGLPVILAAFGVVPVLLHDRWTTDRKATP